MDFDFGDCPPVEQLVDSLVDFYLTNDDDSVTTQADVAIAVLQQWKSHASQVIKEEES